MVRRRDVDAVTIDRLRSMADHYRMILKSPSGKKLSDFGRRAIPLWRAQNVSVARIARLLRIDEQSVRKYL